jgi:hypothetical protein
VRYVRIPAHIIDPSATFSQHEEARLLTRIKSRRVRLLAECIAFRRESIPALGCDRGDLLISAAATTTARTSAIACAMRIASDGNDPLGPLAQNFIASPVSTRRQLECGHVATGIHLALTRRKCEVDALRTACVSTAQHAECVAATRRRSQIMTDPSENKINHAASERHNERAVSCSNGEVRHDK